MKQIKIISGYIAFIGLALTGCQTGGGDQMAGNVLMTDATHFTTGELYAYFAEQTQVRENGGVYYTEFRTQMSLENGKREESTWVSYDGGKLCRNFEDREDGPCEIYYHNDDVSASYQMGKQL